MHEERQKLLIRINALGKNGVGITGYQNAFGAIENGVSQEIASDQITEAINQLSVSVADQEKHIQEAKAKRTGAPSGNTASTGGQPKCPPILSCTHGLLPANSSKPQLFWIIPTEYADIIAQHVNAQPVTQQVKVSAMRAPCSFSSKRCKHRLVKVPTSAVKHKLYIFQQSHPSLNYD